MSINTQIDYGTLVFMMNSIFPNDGESYRWLMTQNKALNYDTPYLHMLSNQDGITRVMRLLREIRKIVDRG